MLGHGRPVAQSTLLQSAMWKLFNGSTSRLDVYAYLWGQGRPDAQTAFKLLCTTDNRNM